MNSLNMSLNNEDESVELIDLVKDDYEDVADMVSRKKQLHDLRRIPIALED